MCLDAGHVRLRPVRRSSRRFGKLHQAAVFLAALGTPGHGALPAAPMCRLAPLQETPTGFLDQFMSRMEISDVRKFAKSNAAAKVIRYAAPTTGFRLDLEQDENQALLAVEGSIRQPAAQDMPVFKEAAMHAFSYFWQCRKIRSALCWRPGSRRCSRDGSPIRPIAEIFTSCSFRPATAL